MVAPVASLGPSYSVGSPACSGGTVFLVYHKSGTMFALTLLQALANVPMFNNYIAYSESETISYANGHVKGGTVGDHWSLGLDGDDWVFAERGGARAHLINDPSSEWPIPKGVCLVHFYRNPTSLLVSAYNYHRKNCTERWISRRSTCSLCDREAHQEIFSRCAYKCSYKQLLSRVDTLTGLHLEKFRSRLTLYHMSRNLRRWNSSREVLHLSVDDLWLDFNGTFRCLLSFLGLEQEDDILDRVQFLNPELSRFYPEEYARHFTRNFTRNELPWTAYAIKRRVARIRSRLANFRCRPSPFTLRQFSFPML